MDRARVNLIKGTQRASFGTETEVTFGISFVGGKSEICLIAPWPIVIFIVLPRGWKI